MMIMDEIKIWYQNVKGLRTKNVSSLSRASNNYVCFTETWLSNKYVVITFPQPIAVLEQIESMIILIVVEAVELLTAVKKEMNVCRRTDLKMISECD